MASSKTKRQWCGLTYLVLVLVCHIVTSAGAAAEQDESVVEVTAASWQRAYDDNRNLLVLFYKTSGCRECPHALSILDQILGQPEIPSGVQLGKSNDDDLRNKLGVASLPALVFLREKSFVLYDGKFDVERLLEWVGPASQVAMRTLTDESFEHLTQASTGATTGDWLVNFYNSECKDITLGLETVGVRVRGKVIVAQVNMADNPKLVQRFKIQECPHLIYFRKGKMYRYDLPKKDAATIRSFLDGFYKNTKAERIPIPKSSFDYLTEALAQALKERLEGENRNTYLGVIAATVLILTIILLTCCKSLLQGPPKEKPE